MSTRGLIDPGRSPREARAIARRDSIEPGTVARIDAVLLVLLVACLAAVVADIAVVRAALVLAAASVVPGWAVLTCLRPTDLLTTAALSVALSVAVEIVGSLILGWIGWWQPAVLASVLAGGSALLLVRHLVETTRRSTTANTGDAPCP